MNAHGSFVRSGMATHAHLFAHPMVKVMQERRPDADLTEFAYTMRLQDITFECLRRARRIVERLDGPATPAVNSDPLPSPRGRKIGRIVTILRAKQCAREAIPMPSILVAEYLATVGNELPDWRFNQIVGGAA